MNQKIVTVIIPTLLHNFELLADCLHSLSRQKNIQFDVIVVGNTNQQILRQFESSHQFDLNISWICAQHNVGFTGAVNLGAKHCQTKYLVLLNDDTTVAPNWLANLVNQAEKFQAAMVASQIYLSNQKTVDSTGFTFFWRGKAEAIRGSITEHQFKNRPDYWLNNQSLFSSSTQTANFWREPFGPDGAAALYSRQLWDELGGMTDSFFAYLEDVDFAFRARLKGYSCVLAKKAVVYHHKHATSKQMGNFKNKQDFLNWWKICLVFPRSAWFKFWWLILWERMRNLSGYLKSMNQ